MDVHMDVHILEHIRVASAVRVLRAVLGVTGQVCGVRARVRRACARLQRVLLTPGSSPGPKPVQVQNLYIGSSKNTARRTNQARIFLHLLLCWCPILDLLFVPARYDAEFRGRFLGPRELSLPLAGVTAHARPAPRPQDQICTPVRVACVLGYAAT